jgi:hypothetical protein
MGSKVSTHNLFYGEKEPMKSLSKECNKLNSYISEIHESASKRVLKEKNT